ncbi:class I SAM-dependent methyltransferase [Paludisphaera mucosa]|uniref:Methyltransferase domain-containing protein n=1 Tax=Paludisphaera mucosa TaxID=3030827 RepID=A0ABT6FJB1_9BACT|nr:methyltransferase domain-containing protein [Paludisphaera mucosa]MDG3007640.1 methyltransferase domain-containing protein [Paludisphaera mucosa]
MSEAEARDEVLDTDAGEFPLLDYRLRRGGREWTVLHVAAILTDEDETRALVRKTNRLPYGVSLWPSAIALGHEVAVRAADFRGRSVLELGAGVGLPGIVAASLGGRAVQTDRDELALHLCRRNAERNGLGAIDHRLADWTEWAETGRYDWILAADVLYSDSLHPHLRRIFETNLAPGGRVLLSDPFRPDGLRFLEGLEAIGWTVTFSKWEVGDEATPRTIGVFELTPPTGPR